MSLKKATFVKLRAQSVDFLEVHNPRATLEVALRQFSCLTVGDIIRIPHADKFFELEVREVQPDGAASIIETDCNVDFEEPLGYKESKYAEYERKAKEAEAKKAAEASVRTLQKARAEPATAADGKSGPTFQAFGGSGRRIDGKDSGSSSSASASSASAAAIESKSDSQSKQVSNPPIRQPAEPAQVVYESRIGDKFSKKKNAVAAFAGTGRKLNG